MRMLSTVCGITPSSAATTSITTSTSEAPRARIIEKASWPGVSKMVSAAPLGALTRRKTQHTECGKMM